jgi:F-type H+-transporting ATPase subunit b
VGGIGSIGISLPMLIAQLVNFFILLGLLYLVAYKPILRVLDQRVDKVKESMEQTEAIKEQTAHAEEEFKKRLEAASREGQELISRAMRTGEEARQKIHEDARKEAQEIIEKARVEIQRERNEVIDELRREFSDLTIEAAGKVIQRSLDKQAHREYIDKILEESPILRKG